MPNANKSKIGTCRVYRQFRRIMDVLRAFQEIGEGTCKDIQKRLRENVGLNVSERTVLRDIWVLQESCLIEKSGERADAHFNGRQSIVFKATVRIEDVE